MTVGLALRTRDGVKPVYVSVGHLIDLAGAARLVLACGAGRRLPEPVDFVAIVIPFIDVDGEEFYFQARDLTGKSRLR